MKVENVVARCVRVIRAHPKELRRVTAYVTPFATVKVTRQHKHDGRIPSETFVLTIGHANYRDRAYLHDLVRANEPFPVKRLRLEGWPKNKRGKK